MRGSSFYPLIARRALHYVSSLGNCHNVCACKSYVKCRLPVPLLFNVLREYLTLLMKSEAAVDLWIALICPTVFQRACIWSDSRQLHASSVRRLFTACHVFTSSTFAELGFHINRSDSFFRLSSSDVRGDHRGLDQPTSREKNARLSYVS